MIRHEPISPEFERSRARYLATLRDHPDTRTSRALRWIYGLAVRLFCRLTFLLCIGLTLLGCLAMAHSAEGESRDRITIESALSAIVQVESGCTRLGMGSISGRWGIGQDGEVSPFQIHISVLRDLGVEGKRDRIHRDIVYAESIARLILTRYYNRFGNWPETFAAWNGGANGYQRRVARDYSRRVMNLASSL